MSSEIAGVQAKIKKVSPLAMYTCKVKEVRNLSVLRGGGSKFSKTMQELTYS